jgi:CHASE2 domain-containing sensor protein
MNFFNDFFHQRYFFITILIFLLAGILTLIPFNCLFLDPVAKAIGDFDVYDIVYSKLREEQKADTNIVLVNLGNLSRKEIAEQFKLINQYKPRVIGIDAIFEEAKDPAGDSILADAISSIKNLVLVSKLIGFNDGDDLFDSIKYSISNFNDHSSNGFANLPNDDEVNFRTIREIRPYANVMDKRVAAFSTKIVQLSDSSAYSNLNERENETERINFVGNYDKFYYLDAEQLFNEKNNLNFMKDKIVLLGFMGLDLNTKTFEDIYFTPLNERYAGKSFPDMYGVVIHANIISMILSGNYITEIPKWLGIIISFLICYFNVFMIYNIRKKYKDWFGTYSKTYILLQSLLLLLIGVLVLHYFNYRFNITLILAALVITSTVNDIYQHYIIKFLPGLESPLRIKTEIENEL